MKRVPRLSRLLLMALVIALMAAVAGVMRKPAEAPPVALGESTEGHLAKVTDPLVVFKKAFWRLPAGDDKILHAERREWIDPEDGVQKWQWFIAVRPGPELLTWLKTNPFSLAPTKSPASFISSPAWFPEASGEFDVHQHSEGRFTLMFSAGQKELYATDSGLGFGPPHASR